ncbi:hypothetical protein BVY01_02415 [bacterium I07]|nr:hypothetical protein BVY01_02415 [bacterium I07]
MINKVISHFKILDKLGEGGMGVVYKAHDTKLDRTVALKFLPSHITANETDKARFLQEAKVAAAINHSNVCVIYEIREHENQQFIVMEYVEGVTLSEKLKSGPLELKTVIDYAMQIGEGLKAAHVKGIVHRDIKSSNIMVTDTNQIKVMDFGLAKLRGSTKLTKTTSTIGTLAYMSPEHLQNKEIDARTDIFSFGVVLYEMLTGELPFKGDYDSALMYSIVNTEPEPVAKFRTDFSSEFLHIMNRVLEKDPEDRYQTVKDVVIDLKRVKRDSDRVVKKVVSLASIAETKALQPEMPGKLKKKRSRLPLLAVLLTIVVVIAAIFKLKLFEEDKPSWLGNETTSVPITTKYGNQIGYVSPDGSSIAYMDLEGHINVIIKHIETGSEKLIHLPESVDIINIYWGPDSKQLAITSFNKLLETKVYFYNLTSASIIRTLEHPSRCWGFMWSPDGQYLASTAEKLIREGIDRHLVIIRLRDGNIIKKQLKCDRVSNVAWHPDSRKVALLQITGETSCIRVYHLDTDELDSLTGVEPILRRENDDIMVWDPDGRFFIFVAGIIDEGKKRRGDALFAVKWDSRTNTFKGDATPITSISNEVYITKPHFISGEGQLAYNQRIDNYNVYILSFDLIQRRIGDQITNVATGRKSDREPCWTPDGQSVVFSSDRDGYLDLYRYDLGTGSTHRLTDTPDHDEKKAQVSHDSRFISYMANDSLFIIPFSGRKRRNITPDSVMISDDCTPIWSMDDQAMFLVTRRKGDPYYGDLIQIDIQTCTYQSILSNVLFEYARIQLSPNGNKIAIFQKDYDLPTGMFDCGYYDLKAGKYVHVIWRTFVHHGQISWTSDGQAIFYEYYATKVDGWESPCEIINIANKSTAAMQLNLGGLGSSFYFGPLNNRNDGILVTMTNWDTNIYKIESSN